MSKKKWLWLFHFIIRSSPTVNLKWGGLLIPFLLFLFGCRENRLESTIPLRTNPAVYLLFDYAGNSLLNENGEPIRTRRDPEDSATPIFPGSPPAVRNRPFLIEYDGEICLSALTPFYFRHESGLRLLVCSPSFRRQSEQLRRILINFDDDVKPTAYPVYQDDLLEIRRGPPSRLRLSGKITASIDGDYDGSPLKKWGMNSTTVHLESRAGNLTSLKFAPVLFRTFPDAGFHLLTTSDKAVLLYESAHDSSIMSITFHSAELAVAIGRGIGRLPALRDRIIELCDREAPTVSEIYFAAQGEKTRAFLELAAPVSHNIRHAVTIGGADGTTIEREIFIFAGGVQLPDTGEINTDTLISVDDGAPAGARTISFEDFRLRGASSDRTLTVDGATDISASEALHPAHRCLLTAPCGSRGLHPRFLKSPEPTPTPADFCVPEDYSLTEFNPFGVIENIAGGTSSSDRLSAGGKFLEIAVRRRCLQGKILFYAGGTPLEPGFGEADPGTPILFVASRRYFAAPSAPAVAALTSLTPQTEPRLLHLPTMTERNLRPVGTSDNAFIFGDRQYSMTEGDIRNFRRVHSLVYDESDDGRRELFHAHESAGLRPDLAPVHAMSPGFLSSGRGEATPSLFLSEILPAGSIDAAGTSIASDEFVEFRADTPPEEPVAGLFHLLIRETGGGERNFLFPAPRFVSTGQVTNAYVVLSREEPRCFSPASAITAAPDLMLPNRAAEYFLYDDRDNLLDSFNLDPLLYTELNAEGRRSIHRIADSDLWIPSILSPAIKTQSCPTPASPGGPAVFHPFFTVAEESDSGLLDFYAPDFELHRVRWLAGPDLPRLVAQSEISVQSGESHRPAPNSLPEAIRILLVARDPDDPATVFYAGEYFPGGIPLIFDAVAPTPSTGEAEWIRLCSVTGSAILADGRPLLVTDFEAEDEIVPWETRFPLTAPPVSLETDSLILPAGECALLVDPDYGGNGHVFDPRERSIWTIASGSSLGNGLASGEGLLLYRRNSSGDIIPLASFGLPETPASFSLPTSTGEYVQRLPGTILDKKENFRFAR